MTKRRNEGSSLSFAFEGWFDPSFSTIPVTVIVFRLYVSQVLFFFWLEAFRRSLSSLECGLIIDVVLANRRLAVDYPTTVRIYAISILLVDRGPAQ